MREVHTSSLDNREPYTAYKVWLFASQAMLDSRHVATAASTASTGWFHARLELWLCLTFLSPPYRTMFRGEQSKLRYTDNAACATMPAPKLAARRPQPLTMLLSNNASGSLPTMPLQMTMPQPALLEHSR